MGIISIDIPKNKEKESMKYLDEYLQKHKKGD